MKVIAPQILENLVRTLARASAEQVRVSPRGGNSSQEQFLQTPNADLCIDLRQLNHVIEYEPANLTVSVQAGMPLAELQSTLRAHRQFLPIDPPQVERATIGGMIAANAYGPLRLRYGTVRDWLIGVRVVLADGTMIHGGGKVVKNVAGYDLPKLFVGSFGTLGVISEATFKLTPLPEHTLTLQAQFPSHGAALKVMLPMLHWSVLPNAMELLGPLVTRVESDAYTLLVQMAGTRGMVERQAADAERLCQESDAQTHGWLDSVAEEREWRHVRDLPATLSEADITLLEARLLPSQLDEALSAILALNIGRQVESTLFVRALQSVWIALRGSDADVSESITRLRAFLHERKGYLVIQRLVPSLAGQVDVWGTTGSDFIVMRRVKARFDPQKILNTGVFVGGI